MSVDGKRPGGLTALAVINFIFGGFGALALIGLFALLGAASEAERAQARDVVPGVVWFLIFVVFIQVVLLIMSGVGYLGQKRFLGRILGNTYSIVTLVGTAISLGTKTEEFGIGTIIGLVYPVLTLALLNTTFKDDLVN